MFSKIFQSTADGTIPITTNGTHNVEDYEFADVAVPIPPGYIVPSGTASITSNGTHDVSSYANANVNVTAPDRNFTMVLRVTYAHARGSVGDFKSIQTHDVTITRTNGSISISGNWDDYTPWITGDHHLGDSAVFRSVSLVSFTWN